jgi:hypothetical protein
VVNAFHRKDTESQRKTLKTMKTQFYFFILIFNFILIPAQEINIVKYLKQIESGEIEKTKTEAKALLREYPDDPSVQFLNAVITTDGETALNKYLGIYNNYPQSRYADASLYRIFSYYYSLGIYKKAENYLTKLKSEYPASPYIKAADRNIPDEETLTAEETEQPAKVKTEDTYNFTIQAGAFMNISNAKNLKSKLEAEGYFSDVRTKSVGGTIFNVVIVGKFNSEEQAESLLEALKKNFKLNGRIIPL